MMIYLKLNGQDQAIEAHPGQSLLDALRAAGTWSVKHGCDTGECGTCAILLDGKLAPSCIIPAQQADGHAILTVEGLTEGLELHPIQQAFIETGAIQCGFCTPAQMLAAKALLDANPKPTENEIRTAIAGVLCRCTGYVRSAPICRARSSSPRRGSGRSTTTRASSSR